MRLKVPACHLGQEQDLGGDSTYLVKPQKLYSNQRNTTFESRMSQATVRLTRHCRKIQSPKIVLKTKIDHTVAYGGIFILFITNLGL